MKKMFIGNLPPNASEKSVREMFSAFGTVRSINVVSDIFTGKSAQAALDGSMIEGSDRSLRVRFDEPRGRGRKRR